MAGIKKGRKAKEVRLKKGRKNRRMGGIKEGRKEGRKDLKRAPSHPLV